MTQLSDNFEAVVARLKTRQATFWINPHKQPCEQALAALPCGMADIQQAADRLQRFAPLLALLFPEVESTQGIIESPLLKAASLGQAVLGEQQGALYIKADHRLPVTGSVKARGGFYEVLLIAEQLALASGLIDRKSCLSQLASAQLRVLFSSHTIAVGSTGNLGLSIGTIASALGFKAVVHMSHDAKTWKKDKLRSRGVEVIEHKGDYAKAVAAGRAQAIDDPLMHFIDDENSLPLFLGYSVAALRLKAQLQQAGIQVDQKHPLLVYIPCGVGGAPGGITFGLKHVFGDHVHCFFAEPAESPCMLVQLASGQETAYSVYEAGLNNKTEADGLAVASASLLVANMMRHLVSGIYTVPDQTLFNWLYLAEQTESLKIEPSAAAGFSGPANLLSTQQGQSYIDHENLQPVMHKATHLVWTTGGMMVPLEEFDEYRSQSEYGKQVGG